MWTLWKRWGNCIDLYAPNPDFRSYLGKALEGRREKFILQAHLCSVWKDGQYKEAGIWTKSEQDLKMN